MAVDHTLDRDGGAGDGSAGDQRRRDDAIGNDRMRTAAKHPNALDAYHALTGAANAGAAAVQVVGKVADLRLTRRVCQRSDALGSASREQNLLRRTDTGKRQGNVRALQTVRCAAVEPAVPLLYDGAQTAQRLEVHIDRPLSDLTAAGQTEPDSPLLGEHRSQKQNGAARLTHERIGNIVPRDAVIFDDDHAVAALSSTAQPAEDPQRGLGVRKLRTIVEHALALRQHRCRQKRQRAVLCPLELHVAAEPLLSRHIQF